MLIEMSAGVLKLLTYFSLWFYIWNVYIIRGPTATEDEESISSDGADEKQQNNDAENKVEDAQNELNEANRPESSPESSKKPACRLNNVIRGNYNSCMTIMTLKRSVTILKHLNLALNNFRFVVRQIFFMAIFHVKVQRCVYVIFGYYYCQSDMQYKKQVCLSEDGFFFRICIYSLWHFFSSALLLQRMVKLFFGCVAAVACGMLYAVYLSTYHDRKFWFSTKQVCDF